MEHCFFSCRKRPWSLVCLLLSSAQAFSVAPLLRIPRRTASLARYSRSFSDFRNCHSSQTCLQSQVSSTVSSESSLQIQREIVRFGKRGKTDEALALYETVERPTVRQMNGAIDACARARPTRLDEAFRLLDDGIQKKHLTPNVFTFGALMSACSRARRADRALALLKAMQVCPTTVTTPVP